MSMTISALARAGEAMLAGVRELIYQRCLPLATQQLTIALATIPANLADIDPADPMGLKVGDLEDKQAAAEAQEVDTSTYGNMQTHFDGVAGAFAYLLFVLLYMPCAAASCASSTAMGYSAAITGPRRSRISRHSAPEPI